VVLEIEVRALVTILVSAEDKVLVVLVVLVGVLLFTIAVVFVVAIVVLSEAMMLSYSTTRGQNELL
jgi:uncharacterized membrane protein